MKASLRNDGSRPFACFAILLLASSLLAQTAAEPLRFPSVPPTPPAEAEKTIEALHGFKMQLIAAEPLVTSPVAITYDEDGRAFVCEMNDYPYTDKAQHKASQENPTDAPIGKVHMLVDTDGDGVFDKSTVFADGLSWPTGSVCWKGGIIVVATPDIWYFKDTKGTGVADVRQKLFTGLKKLNVQAVANNPIWSLDNKIYIAGGSNGGTLVNLVHPEEKPIPFRRNDLILDPEKMTIELASGGARFGNTRDDWGNRFLCNIRNPLEHVVIEQRYLARNPYMPPVNPLADVAESGDQLPVYRISPPEAWREFRAKRWSGDSTVIAHMPRSELVGSGVVTSSSGCTIYRGDAYPKEFYGNAFVADVAGNLFYRLALTPDGVTFKGTRIDGKKEMVASRDIWFRPVNFANAPDGTLTVCDMYREVIEHPWSLPDDIHAALDLERGRDKGRLYRLSPPNFKRRKTPQLSQASTAELVALLAHPNAWHRDTAHRLLFERQDKSAVPLLRELTMVGLTPQARAQALWSTHALTGITVEALAAVLKNDKDPRVREQAVQIAEQYPRMIPRLLADVRFEEDERVLFKTILTCGGFAEQSLEGAVAEATLKKLEDPWVRSAALMSSTEAMFSLAGALMRNAGRMDNKGIAESRHPEALADLMDRVGFQIGSQPDRSLHKTLLLVLYINNASNPVAVSAGFRGLVAGMQRQQATPAEIEGLSAKVIQWIESVATGYIRTSLDDDSRLEDRVLSISGLTLVQFPKLQPIAAKLLQPSEPDAIRMATIKLLSQQREAKVGDLLLEAWPTLTPGPREAALQAMMARPQLVGALLSAIEQGRIKPAEISATARTLLSKNANLKVRERTAQLFGGGGSRAEAIAKYQSALTLTGDAATGHKVYQTICAACHRKGEEGRDIGPNLATIMSWSSEQMLTNILDPNREVSPNFLLYIVETNDGRTLSGLITSETPSSVALKGADGIEVSVARSEVKSLKSAGISLMPEGLEATITPQQMADLMAFLKS